MRIPFVFLAYAIIFLSYISSSCLLGNASKFKNVTDREALMAIKDAITSDPNGVFNSWNASLHYCNWQGISCSRKHPQRVTVIDLSSRGLVGRASPYIGNLSFLRIILLHNNTFHGEIPPEIGKLARLRAIRLANNSFHGDVPTNLTSCISLRYINFIDNNLEGKFPVELSSIPNLAALGLGKNNFHGKIPPSVGNFSALSMLSLIEANLEGNIPEEIGHLTRLEFLTVAQNNLAGSLPSSLYNLSRLTMLSVGSNRLKGNLVPDIGFRLPNLQQLYVGINQFTGTIPSSLSNASQLEIIAFAYNRFSGLIPIELGKLVNLTWASLGANMLGNGDGNDLKFIAYLTNCTKLELLELGENFLKGSLPEAIANLSTQIKYLSFGTNQIYGVLPPGIGNLVSLNFLNIEDQMLGGNIPDGIGNLENLGELHLARNQLVGEIPVSIGNLSNLYYMDLTQNNLSGNIPPTLGNCRGLTRFDLSENELQGSIPASLFTPNSIVFINLSSNSLSGTLSSNVGNLKQLETFDISENKVSGGIPSSLRSCLSLVTIRMNGNLFQGTIPESFSALRGLDVLDLSHNNLSGAIPEGLGRIPLLKILDLSFNDLEGEIPQTGIFKNSSIVSLIGNSKLCGGIPELKLHTCTTSHSNKRNSLAVKVIAPLIFVGVCLALFAGCILLRHKKKKLSRFASLNNHFIRVSYQQLVQATDGFSDANLIGSGSYASVYKGFLHEIQSSIAVKVFNLHQRGASKSFISECKALRNIRHRNLLKIISVCASIDYQGTDFRAVIYELMARGSLENWLHQQEVETNEHELRNLNLKHRLNIAIDVASAVEYLHCHCQPPVVHSDLKPSNVLLDDEMAAHVGDFGLAKVLSRDSTGRQTNKSSSAIIKGTVGYVPPEYGMGEGASVQGDVYSFGILLLEVFTGRRPTDAMFQGDLNLHSFTRMSLAERVMDVVDQNLLPARCREEKKVQDCLASLLRIGVSCSVEMPKDRIEIRDVVRELHLIKKAYEKQDTHAT